jgi:hypothetical protein
VLSLLLLFLNSAESLQSTPRRRISSRRTKINKYHEMKNHESCSSGSLINSGESAPSAEEEQEALIEGLKTRN